MPQEFKTKTFEEEVIDVATYEDEFAFPLLKAMAKYMKTQDADALVKAINEIHESAHVSLSQRTDRHNRDNIECLDDREAV